MIDFAMPDNIIPMPQKSNEWYTPARYVEAAREVMGSIDLDPASCKEANMVVRASKFYTERENGLAHDWYGNVWLNPPYGRTDHYGSNIGAFAIKLIEEYKQSKVNQAILLSTAKVSTSWFSLFWEYPICFVDHIVGFYIPSKGKELKAHSHIHDTIFVYLGANEQRFIDIFSQFGTVARRVSTPKERPVNLSLWEVPA